MGAALSQAATIRLDNIGTSTGDNLDELSGPTTGIVVAEVPGLFIAVHNIAGSGSGTDLNATSVSLGINSGDSGDDTDGFDASFGESVTFSFDKAVSLTQLDFAGFESGEVFAVGLDSINFSDLTNGTTDIYDFSAPLIIAANTQITIGASSGVIGIEGMTLTVVPFQ